MPQKWLNGIDQSEVGMKVEVLQQLVSELSKDQPEQKLVKQLMLQCKLSYSQDPMIQMTTVLESIDQLKTNKTDVRRKEHTV